MDVTGRIGKFTAIWCFEDGTSVSSSTSTYHYLPTNLTFTKTNVTKTPVSVRIYMDWKSTAGGASGSTSSTGWVSNTTHPWYQNPQSAYILTSSFYFDKPPTYEEFPVKP